jgi:hypothetical protein
MTRPRYKIGDSECGNDGRKACPKEKPKLPVWLQCKGAVGVFTSHKKNRHLLAASPEAVPVPGEGGTRGEL